MSGVEGERRYWVRKSLGEYVQRESLTVETPVPMKNEIFHEEAPMSLKNFEAMIIPQLKSYPKEVLNSFLLALMIKKKVAFVAAFLKKDNGRSLDSKVVVKLKEPDQRLMVLGLFMVPILINSLECFEVIQPYLKKEELDWSADKYFSNGQSLLHFALTYCEDEVVLLLLQVGRFDYSAAISATETSPLVLDTRLLYYAADRSIEVFNAFLKGFDGNPADYLMDFKGRDDKREHQVAWFLYQVQYFYRHRETLTYFPSDRTQALFNKLSEKKMLEFGYTLFLLRQLSQFRVSSFSSKAESLAYLGLRLILEEDLTDFFDLLKSELGSLNVFFEVFHLNNEFDILERFALGSTDGCISLLYVALLTVPDRTGSLVTQILKNLACKDEKAFMLCLKTSVLVASQFKRMDWMALLLSLWPKEPSSQGLVFLGDLLVDLLKNRHSFESIALVLEEGANPFVLSQEGSSAYDFLSLKEHGVESCAIVLALLNKTNLNSAVPLRTVQEFLMRWLAVTLQSSKSDSPFNDILKFVFKIMKDFFVKNFSGQSRAGDEELFNQFVMYDLMRGLNPLHVRFLDPDFNIEELKKLHQRNYARLALTNGSLFAETLLHLGVRSGNIILVREMRSLLPEFFHPWFQNAAGYSPLSLAFSLKMPEMIKVLLLDESNKIRAELIPFLQHPINHNRDTLAHALALHLSQEKFYQKLFDTCFVLLDWTLKNCFEDSAFEILCAEKRYEALLSLLEHLPKQVDFDAIHRRTGSTPRQWLLQEFHTYGGKSDLETDLIYKIARTELPFERVSKESLSRRDQARLRLQDRLRNKKKPPESGLQVASLSDPLSESNAKILRLEKKIQALEAELLNFKKPRKKSNTQKSVGCMTDSLLELDKKADEVDVVESVGSLEPAVADLCGLRSRLSKVNAEIASLCDGMLARSSGKAESLCFGASVELGEKLVGAALVMNSK